MTEDWKDDQNPEQTEGPTEPREQAPPAAPPAASPAAPPSASEPTFAELFEASLDKAPPARLAVGDEVTGTVLQVGKEWTFLDIGAKGEALIATSELLGDDHEPSVTAGDTVDGRVVRQGREGLVVSRVLQGGASGRRVLEEAHELQMPVEGTVEKVIKGGLEVQVAGVRAFCPASQVDIRFVEDLEEFVGRRLEFRVSEYREGGRSVVLSRKALLAEQREKEAEQTRAKLAVGARLRGTVTNIREFGAFVDLGGLEGLVHVSEISHARVERVADVLREGQSVEVEVLKIDGDRLSLSMKALEGDPWDSVSERFPEGSRHPGVVSRVQPYGAFVEIAPGVDGLLHVSTLDDPRITDAQRAFEPGQELEVQVLSLDLERQRVSLAPADRATADGAAVELRPGVAVTGTVERVEPYGVFLRLPGPREGGRPPRALLPREEMAEGAGDPRRAYNLGDEVRVQVIEPDEKGRMRLSIRALREQAERQQVQEYLGQAKGKAGGGGKDSGGKGGGGFGTLGDLLKKKL
jgi:small subunit ribosomal protein S1